MFQGYCVLNSAEGSREKERERLDFCAPFASPSPPPPPRSIFVSHWPRWTRAATAAADYLMERERERGKGDAVIYAHIVNFWVVDVCFSADSAASAEATDRLTPRRSLSSLDTLMAATGKLLQKVVKETRSDIFGKAVNNVAGLQQDMVDYNTCLAGILHQYLLPLFTRASERGIQYDRKGETLAPSSNSDQGSGRECVCVCVLVTAPWCFIEKALLPPPAAAAAPVILPLFLGGGREQNAIEFSRSPAPPAEVVEEEEGGPLWLLP